MNGKQLKTVRNEEEQKRASEVFNDLRNELLKRDLSNTENYDKAILTLSAAALGISLTAIRFVVPLEGAEYFWLIKYGWGFLSLSMIISLAAFLMSNKAISIQLKNAEGYYIDGLENARNRKNRYATINNGLNKATGLLFALAIIAIMTFVIINIDPKENTMKKNSNSTKATPVIIRESANVPTIQKIPSEGETAANSANIPTMQQVPGTQTTSQGSNSDSSKDEGKTK